MRVGLVVIVLAACGRIGFDASSDGAVSGDDSTIDAPPGAPFLVDIPAIGGISDLALLPDGGVVAVGAHTGNLTIDGVSATGVGAIDALVLALDPDGHVRWIHQWGGTENDVATSVATAADGSIYVGGVAENMASLGGAPRSNQGLDAFLAKYNSDGDYVWSIGFGGVESSPDRADAAFGIAIAPDQDVVVVGQVAATVDFGAGNTSANGAFTDAFVARYSPDGVLRWARRFGSQEVNQASGVAVSTDAVFISGFYSGTPTFGTFSLPGRGGNDAFVLRLAGNGTSVPWVSTFGGGNNQRAYGVTLVGTTVVSAGYYWDTVDLPSIGVPADEADGLVVAYNQIGGGLAWARRFGSTGCDFFEGATTDGSTAIVAGAFENTVAFDGPITATGLSDNVAFAVGETGVLWHRNFGDATDEIVNGIVGSEAALYMGGARNLNLDSGCNINPGATSGYIRRF